MLEEDVAFCCRETVLTIVSHEKYGFESLRFCRHVKTKDGATTPMRMLIVYMPG